MLNKDNLHDYQLRAIEHIVEVDNCGLFLDMGLGKTVSTLTAVSILMFEELAIDNALVIGPKRVVESVWHREIKKWEHLKDLTYSRIIGTAKQRRAAIKDKVDIHLIGRDNVQWLVDEFGGDMLPWDMLIIDESSSFKNPKSKRFKALRLVRESFTKIVILTGTPSPNGLQDIWAQIFLLDGGKRLGKFITRFREMFFNNVSRSHQYVKLKIKEESEQQIYDKISDICISMKAEDYLDLPPRINNTVEVTFDKKLQEAYDGFKDEQMLLMFEDAEITAANAAALMNKLLQFANGAVYENPVYDIDEEGDLKQQPRVYHEVHNLKIKALEEILESAGGKPVLVAWTYRHDLYRIEKYLKKYKPERLEDDDTIERWNNGEIPLLLMHPASGGHGLNLQDGGHIIVWFGQTWSLELYQQFNARLDRQGQTESVIVHHICASKTIDNKVLARLSDKAYSQQALFDAVKAEIREKLKK